MNTVCLIGRVTVTPELRYTQSGKAVTNFSLAVDRRYSAQGQERQTDFIPIVAWENTAEFAAKHITKGQRIGLTGSLQTRSFTDRDGTRRIAYEVVAESVDFADGKRETQATAPEGFSEAASDGELPF